MNGKDFYNTFLEFDDHLNKDDRPSLYFNNKLSSGIFYDTYPFILLGDLIKTEQEPLHHPEGNVWNHTMLVLDQCVKYKMESENPRVFMWAGLLHDLGKASTTKLRKGKLTSYDHDKVGEKLSKDFLQECTEDVYFIDKVSKLVRWHMQTLFVAKNLPIAEVGNMLSQVSLKEVALLSLCDRLGRGNMTEQKIEEEKNNIRIFVEKCKVYEKVEK